MVLIFTEILYVSVKKFPGNSRIFQIILFKIPDKIKEFFNAILKLIEVQATQTTSHCNNCELVEDRNSTRLYLSFSTIRAAKLIE